MGSLTNIVTNIINESLNYTPVGYARYANADHYLREMGNMDLYAGAGPDAQKRSFFKATVGTGSLVALNTR